MTAQPMPREERFAHFDEAIDAGMTGDQAGRWVTYVERKATRGEQPIPLWEAVVQIEIAHRDHRQALAAVAAANQLEDNS